MLIEQLSQAEQSFVVNVIKNPDSAFGACSVPYILSRGFNAVKLLGFRG